ncbi:hypothetical protein FNJ15_21830 [Salmonella enterica subsp. diarizonae]|nr:hypothetical protein [Salmonella enterica subsp. diarizonae]
MKKLLLSFILGMLCFGSLVLIRDKLQPKFISPCSANLIIKNNETQFNILIDFLLIQNDGTGVVTVSGTYFKNDKKTGVIRRSINFQWGLHDHVYSLSAQEIRKSERDESLSDNDLKELLPLFFIRSGGKIDFTVNRDGDGGYIFSNGIRPLFFCEETE